MGNNNQGQLGDGVLNAFTNIPQEIVASGVTAIAAGENHSLFLKSDGSLWAMGFNSGGQLGDGTFASSIRPKEIVTNGVTAIAAGANHSLFLKSDGSVWAMGADFFGQLGDSANNDTAQPEEIIAGGVTAIAAGYDHSLFLKSDGSLWATGENNNGELGDGFDDVYSPNYGTHTPEQIFPRPQPVLTQTVSNADLQFTAPCGFGGNFYLLTSTSLTQPLNQWTPIWTNVIASRFFNVFSATLTNALNSGSQQFFILQSQ